MRIVLVYLEGRAANDPVVVDRVYGSRFTARGKVYAVTSIPEGKNEREPLLAGEETTRYFPTDMVHYIVDMPATDYTPPEPVAAPEVCGVVHPKDPAATCLLPPGHIGRHANSDDEWGYVPNAELCKARHPTNSHAVCSAPRGHIGPHLSLIPGMRW